MWSSITAQFQNLFKNKKGEVGKILPDNSDQMKINDCKSSTISNIATKKMAKPESEASPSSKLIKIDDIRKSLENCESKSGTEAQRHMRPSEKAAQPKLKESERHPFLQPSDRPFPATNSDLGNDDCSDDGLRDAVEIYDPYEMMDEDRLDEDELVYSEDENDFGWSKDD